MGIGIIILGLAVDKLDYLFRMIGKIQQSLSVDPEYFLTLIKMIGITYIGQFSAGSVKMQDIRQPRHRLNFCKLSVMVLSIPVLMALLETIQEFLG